MLSANDDLGFGGVLVGVEISHPEGQDLLDYGLGEVSGHEDAHPLSVIVLFNVIYDGLLEKLKNAHPGISKTDMKICVYTKLNLSTKEIADIMNISVRSVEMARYRLRKRLGLPPGQDINLSLKEV